jgi:hypothetical protein
MIPSIKWTKRWLVQPGRCRMPSRMRPVACIHKRRACLRSVSG